MTTITSLADAKEVRIEAVVTRCGCGDPLSPADTEYVARIVSRYTGLTPQAALARVSATYSQLQQKVSAIENAAKTAADHARRAGVSASLWLFVSLLMGAFAASFMAVFGGRLRDV